MAFHATLCAAFNAASLAFVPSSPVWSSAPTLPQRGAPPTMVVLKGISPLLTPELLSVLRSAGHKDVRATPATPRKHLEQRCVRFTRADDASQKIVVADTNFPAATLSRTTIHGTNVLLAGVTAPEALEAIATHLPIESIEGDGVVVMLPPPGLELPPLGAEV
eukprot:3027001-Prymnesium_polylepis.1